jgi:hypothetical protein
MSNHYATKALGTALFMAFMMTPAGCADPKPVVQPLPAPKKPNAPGSFQKTFETNWQRIEIRKGMTMAEAWKRIYEFAMEKYDLDQVQREDYYMRSHWNYTHATKGEYESNYRTRFTCKLYPDSNIARFRIEAQFNEDGKGGWIEGTDMDMIRDLKDDIKMTIGQ